MFQERPAKLAMTADVSPKAWAEFGTPQTGHGVLVWGGLIRSPFFICTPFPFICVPVTCLGLSDCLWLGLGCSPINLFAVVLVLEFHTKGNFNELPKETRNTDTYTA